MKDSMTDKIEGDLDEVKGKVKEKVGQVTNDPDGRLKVKPRTLTERSKTARFTNTLTARACRAERRLWKADVPARGLCHDCLQTPGIPTNPNLTWLDAKQLHRCDP